MNLACLLLECRWGLFGQASLQHVEPIVGFDGLRPGQMEALL